MAGNILLITQILKETAARIVIHVAVSFVEIVADMWNVTCPYLINVFVHTQQLFADNQVYINLKDLIILRIWISM